MLRGRFTGTRDRITTSAQHRENEDTTPAGLKLVHLDTLQIGANVKGGWWWWSTGSEAALDEGNLACTGTCPQLLLLALKSGC